MAVETVKQITAPPEFIESEAKLYLDQLRKGIGAFKGADLSQVYGPQFVAGMGQLTQDAISKAGGLGAFQPFLTTAAQRAGEAGQLTGPTAYKQFMSPYQQDVIDTTLREFDVQTQKGLPGLAAQAIGAGAFGGGREGVQRAEYLTGRGMDRAQLQANLLAQNFNQARSAAQQDFMNRQNLSTQQLQLAQTAPALAGQEISALTTLGGLQQAQSQAQLAAQQQLKQQQMMQPLTAAQQYGSGVTSLIAGYPGSVSMGQQAIPSPLQTAIGAGATLAGIYRAI